MAVYKLLIVDDERFVVDSLYSLLEGRQDLDLEISTAYSGKQALSHLEQCKTDIVILDVKMPVVDGLQVYERISVLWPDIYVIFLTGYANFDYIYPVNKEENVIYLLKTEDFDTIVNTVQTMIDRIEKNRNTLTMIDRADRMETLAKQLLSGEVLNGLISGKPLADIQNQLAWFSEEYAFDLDRPIFLMYYRIKWRDISSYSSFTYNEQLMYLTQYIKRVLNNRFSVASHKINMSSSILFLQPVFDYGLAVPPAIYLKENLNEMVELGQRNFIFDVLALLYTRELSWEGIYVIYESLRTYFRCAIEPEIPKYGLGIVVGQHELRKISSQECPSEESNYSTLLDQVSYALYDRNRQGLIAALKQLENTFPPHKGMDDLTTICIYQSISNILIQYINRNNLYKKIGRDIGLYKLYSLNAFPNWPRAYAYLYNTSLHIFSLLEDEDIDYVQKVVHKIKGFIQENLAGDLSLSQLAEYSKYNSTYLSRLFRQATGTNISRYITTMRIDRAKEYLQKTCLPVQEIATKTGYDSPQYFSMVFKRITGMSPKEYRLNL